jgi:hypothetical protein
MSFSRKFEEVRGGRAGQERVARGVQADAGLRAHRQDLGGGREVGEPEQVDHEFHRVTGAQRTHVEDAVAVTHHLEHGQRRREVGVGATDEDLHAGRAAARSGSPRSASPSWPCGRTSHLWWWAASCSPLPGPRDHGHGPRPHGARGALTRNPAPASGSRSASVLRPPGAEAGGLARAVPNESVDAPTRAR